MGGLFGWKKCFKTFTFFHVNRDFFVFQIILHHFEMMFFILRFYAHYV